MAINSDDVTQVYFLYEPIEYEEDGSPRKFSEVIIVVYSNGSTDKLPATIENKGEAQVILDKISTKKIKP